MDIIPMLSSAGIVVGIVLVLAVVGGVVTAVTRIRRIKSLAGAVIDEANRRYPNQRLMAKGATFFGQESHGLAQPMSGTLVITDADLVFMRWVPRQDITIPLKSISGIETPSLFLGRNPGAGKSLLKVNFQNDSGQPDSMAWYVDDLSSAKNALERR